MKNEKKPEELVSGRVCNGAGNRNRTHNLLITNQLLCQLSYASTNYLYNYKVQQIFCQVLLRSCEKNIPLTDKNTSR